MSELFKILAVLLVTAVLCIILKQKNGEYALLVAVAAGLLLPLWVMVIALTLPF